MGEKIFDEVFFASLQRIRIASKIKLNAGMSGNRRSQTKGTSVEFADFREYILGDDIRRIDWNAYGRMDRLFVKLFQEEKEGRFHVLLDVSKSMEQGDAKKGIFAKQIAGMFAYMILQNMDRFSFYPLTGPDREEVRPLKSQTGAKAFMKSLQYIETIEFAGNTDLFTSIKKIPFGGRGVTILITDGFDKELGKMEDVMKYLAYEKQEVLVIHVLSQEEKEPKLEGTYDLLDVENGEQVKVTMTRKLLKAYEKNIKNFMETMEGVCKKYASHYIPVSTEQKLEQFIFEGIKKGQLTKI